MNPQFVTCECGVRLKVQQELAQKAKSVKCPKCASPVDLSVLTWPSEALSTSATSAPAPTRPLRPVPPRPVAAPILDEELAAPTTKDCLYCGEKILFSALKCRHCGEFFDHAKAPSRVAAKVKNDDEPNPAEYFVALLAPIGLLIGLVWAAQKKPKAKGMLKASGLSFTILAVAALMLKLYVFTEDTSGPIAPSAPPDGAPRYVIVPGLGDDSERPSPPGGSQSGRPTDLPGGVDLEGQPSTIQRAMKANVRIEGQRSMGSGVIIQRMDGDVLILTNHHVVTESSNLNEVKDVKTLPRLKISYFNEQMNPGTVLWVAPDGIDLALVKAPAPKEIEPVVWADVAKVKPGEDLFAVGNPLGLGWTFTKGVASALRQEKHGTRDLGIIQSDTKTTFGNSGGGLYNTAGELIGINSSIADPRLGGGISFAIRPQILIELKPDGLILPKDH